MRYAAIFEKGPTSYSGHVPDLPGCVAAGDTRDEVRGLIAEAIVFHVEGLRLAGDPVPAPNSAAEYVEAE